jgi:hypothetical protein
MRFGIVVTDSSQRQNVADLIAEALRRKWPVRCFLTDDGVNLVRDEAFMQLTGNGVIHLSLCELSVERNCKDLDLEQFSGSLIVGGQYQNAELVRNSDQVLVF